MFHRIQQKQKGRTNKSTDIQSFHHSECRRNTMSNNLDSDILSGIYRVPVVEKKTYSKLRHLTRPVEKEPLYISASFGQILCSTFPI